MNNPRYEVEIHHPDESTGPYFFGVWIQDKNNGNLIHIKDVNTLEEAKALMDLFNKFIVEIPLEAK